MPDNWRSVGGYYQRPSLCWGGPALTARYGVYTKEGAALLVVVHFSKSGVWFNEGQRESGLEVAEEAEGGQLCGGDDPSCSPRPHGSPFSVTSVSASGRAKPVSSAPGGLSLSVRQEAAWDRSCHRDPRGEKSNLSMVPKPQLLPRTVVDRGLHLLKWCKPSLRLRPNSQYLLW